jgi:hypothetical protein
LIDLPPGRYFLNVAPPMPLAGSLRFFGGPAQPDSEPRSIGAALYPGTTTATLDDATLIEVKSGEETRLHDVVLTSSRFGEIRVRIINASPSPIERFSVNLANSTPEFGPDDSVGIYGSSVANNNEDKPLNPQGSTVITFWPNALGVHTLNVSVAGENNRRLSLGALVFDVDGRPKDLEITVPSPPADGRLSCRLSLPADSNTLSSNVRVLLRSAANTPATCASGTFTILPAGIYHVTNVTGLAADWYVAGIEQDARDVLRNGAVVSQADLGLNVRIASGAGSFDGKVIDPDGRPVQNALVALLPEGSLKDIPLVHAYKSMRTDQHGMVNIRGIMPGEYVVYTWTGIEDNANRIPAFVKQYEGRGKRLKIDANSKISETLTAIDN